MAHFAKIGVNNKVLQVVCVNNDVILDADGVENEAMGIAFCRNLFGGDWLQTSYNGRIRKNFASVGFSYDTDRDAFIPPQPYPSWTLNEDSCLWGAPVARPNDGNIYTWNEAQLQWEPINND